MYISRCVSSRTPIPSLNPEEGQASFNFPLCSWRRRARPAFSCKSSSAVCFRSPFGFLWRFFCLSREFPPPARSVEADAVAFLILFFFLDQISWRTQWTASPLAWSTIAMSSSGTSPLSGRRIRFSEWSPRESLLFFYCFEIYWMILLGVIYAGMLRRSILLVISDSVVWKGIFFPKLGVLLNLVVCADWF